jgi:hypothetical protein
LLDLCFASSDCQSTNCVLMCVWRTRWAATRAFAGLESMIKMTLSSTNQSEIILYWIPQFIIIIIIIIYFSLIFIILYNGNSDLFKII